MIASNLVCRPTAGLKSKSALSCPKAPRASVTPCAHKHKQLFYIDDSEIPVGQDIQTYLKARTNAVEKSFAGSLSIEDFMARVESVLYQNGFTGENTLAISNMCRDEATNCLRNKVENIFGSLVFSFQSLGGIPTAGKIGMGAGLSHAPLDKDGKESYVFFSFPHISVDSDGEAGPMARAGRAATSCACGAVIGALGAIQSEGLAACDCTLGKHDPLNPEFSILKARLANRIKEEGKTPDELNLVSFTKLTERMVTNDMEALIKESVKEGCNYAVVTGVHVHSWPTEYGSGPRLEFVWPSQFYTMIDGIRTDYNVTDIAPPTPRALSLICENEEQLPSIQVAGT